MASIWKRGLVAALVAGAMGIAGCRTNTGEPAEGTPQPGTGGSGQVETGAPQQPMEEPMGTQDQSGSVGGTAVEQEQQGTYPEASDESIGGSGAAGMKSKDAGTGGYQEEPSTGGSGMEEQQIDTGGSGYEGSELPIETAPQSQEPRESDSM